MRRIGIGEKGYAQEDCFFIDFHFLRYEPREGDISLRERDCIIAGREGDCEDTQKIDFSWTAVGESLTL